MNIYIYKYMNIYVYTHKNIYLYVQYTGGYSVRQ